MAILELSEILSDYTYPRNKFEEKLIVKLRHNRNWHFDHDIVSKVCDYMNKNGFVLTSWSYTMISRPIYSFEEKELAEKSYKYHQERIKSHRTMQPALRGLSTPESLKKSVEYINKIF